MPAVPHGGDLALRRARAGLVLEQSAFGEHTGTHFDAPIHWISGRDLPNNSIDTMPVEHFIAPACVIDCSAEAKARCRLPAHRATSSRRSRSAHGRITAGAWVLMRTDWSKRTDPEAYQNFDETGQHTPGPDPDACGSWCKSATCSASAPRRSAPMPARPRTSRRPIPATTTCTAPASTACSA